MAVAVGNLDDYHYHLLRTFGRKELAHLHEKMKALQEPCVVRQDYLLVNICGAMERRDSDLAAFYISVLEGIVVRASKQKEVQDKIEEVERLMTIRQQRRAEVAAEYQALLRTLHQVMVTPIRPRTEAAARITCRLFDVRCTLDAKIAGLEAAGPEIRRIQSRVGSTKEELNSASPFRIINCFFPLPPSLDFHNYDNDNELTNNNTAESTQQREQGSVPNNTSTAP
ncbi:hypothetical protein EAH_00006350 [Eimeria acervulina]|uniref:Uncharacterized protein n=1 Tax=Eimeria acervulina TaxID=5801 RepID=U6GRD6_EIMAC|nr:hypothetical protein EAH_00006350 [Eimeria acervulina]CDI82750.1 hypothetical protein EAH_00006350 [Eimeria acervulina]